MNKGHFQGRWGLSPGALGPVPRGRWGLSPEDVGACPHEECLDSWCAREGDGRLGGEEGFADGTIISARMARLSRWHLL